MSFTKSSDLIFDFKIREMKQRLKKFEDDYL